jgi:hypothetical protein
MERRSHRRNKARESSYDWARGTLAAVWEPQENKETLEGEEKGTRKEATQEGEGTGREYETGSNRK